MILPVGVEAVGFGVDPGWMWSWFTVDQGLGAMQGQRRYVVVAVGGPEGGGA